MEQNNCQLPVEFRKNRERTVVFLNRWRRVVLGIFLTGYLVKVPKKLTASFVPAYVHNGFENCILPCKTSIILEERNQPAITIQYIVLYYSKSLFIAALNSAVLHCAHFFQTANYSDPIFFGFLIWIVQIYLALAQCYFGYFSALFKDLLYLYAIARIVYPLFDFASWSPNDANAHQRMTLLKL